MCGIAGLWQFDSEPAGSGVIDGLLSGIAHRGPDGHHIWQQQGVTFIHTRLSIIDIDGGTQPLHAPTGEVIIANGEIYNYRELIDEHGLECQTHSDCEVPLHLYRRYGVKGLDLLRGMYALALWDPQREQLILRRDPFGIKPLYYIHTEHFIAFASEPRAFAHAGLDRYSSSQEAMEALRAEHYLTTEQSMLPLTHKMMPGETRIITRKATERQLQSPFDRPSKAVARESLDQAVARFDSAWRESVSLHLRSDVPYGVFLSGGIDSTAIVAAMGADEARASHSFTAYFPESQVADERLIAAATAHERGLRHREVPITAAQCFAHLPAIVHATDDPVADYAIIPTWFLAKEASSHVRVVLSGEGGDELFGGYGRYRKAMRPWWMRWRAAPKGTGPAEWTSLQRLQHRDIEGWLPNDLLLKLDRCLMAHGIEGRTPFLDRPLCADFFHMEDRHKIQGRYGKYMLRQWLSQHMQSYDAFRKKSGFTVPIAEWMHHEASRLLPLLWGSPIIPLYYEKARLEKSLGSRHNREGIYGWTALYSALWYAVHVQQCDPHHDMWSCLEWSRQHKG